MLVMKEFKYNEDVHVLEREVDVLLKLKGAGGAPLVRAVCRMPLVIMM